MYTHICVFICVFIYICVCVTLLPNVLKTARHSLLTWIVFIVSPTEKLYKKNAY